MANRLTEGLARRGSRLPSYVKQLFAATETSGDTSGDWLQLERATFEDLKERGKVRPSIKWDDLSVPDNYDEVATSYINDVMKTHGIPTVEEAALWSWRPGWYRKYGGDISKIPDDEPGVYGKTAKQVMMSRLRNMQAQGF